MRERIVCDVVLLLVLYERFAIRRGWWPTYTAMIRPHRDVAWVFWTGIAVIYVVATLAAIHLYGERGGW